MLPPIYKTERFELRPYSPDDEKRFVEMGTDKVSTEFMGGSTGKESGEIALFRNIFNIYKNKDSNRWFWIWGIYENDKLVGHFELKETEYTNKNELEIVYMIHPNERQRGIMKEVLEFFKNNQTIWNKRIIATLDFENKASISLLENWGIEKKVTLKDEDGEYLKVWLK